MPNTFSIKDYSGVLETGVAIALHRAGINVYTTRGKMIIPDVTDLSEEQEFQKVRPRVGLQFKFQEGRKQYFRLKGIKPEAGFVPDKSGLGVMQVTLATVPDFSQHSAYIGRIRFMFDTIATELEQIFDGNYFIQSIVEEQTDNEIFQEDGAFVSKLQFKVRFSMNLEYKCTDTVSELLGTVTPIISAAEPIAQFGNFEAGNYFVVYRTGAMKYNGGANFQINRSADDHEFKVIHSQGISILDAPGNSQQYFAEVDCVAANVGAETEPFAHTGGQIGVYLQDAPYNDNIGGNENPTFELYRITTVCGFVDQQITLAA